MESSEGGGKWDNFNSIINKYLKKRKKIKFHAYPFCPEMFLLRIQMTVL